jgi:hypothetical protein
MSQNPYYKKYLKYKLKYNNLKNKLAIKYVRKPTIIIEHSLIQTITSELHLEKDIKKVTTIDGINFTGNAEAGSTILLNWDNLSRTVIAEQSGTWRVYFAPSEIPVDSANSILAATVNTIVGVATITIWP